MVKTNLTKKEMEKLSKELTYEPTLVWDEISQAEKEEVFRFCDEYCN